MFHKSSKSCAIISSGKSQGHQARMMTPISTVTTIIIIEGKDDASAIISDRNKSGQSATTTKAERGIDCGIGGRQTIRDEG
jgi:hypothetical protein